MINLHDTEKQKRNMEKITLMIYREIRKPYVKKKGVQRSNIWDLEWRSWETEEGKNL